MAGMISGRLLANATIISWLLCFVSSAHAQQPATPYAQKFSLVFMYNQPPANSPLKIEALLYNNQPISLGDRVPFGENGLNGLVIVVKNVSSRNITKAGFDIAFLDTGRGTTEAPYAATGVGVGQWPVAWLFHRNGEPIPQPPNQPAPVSIPPSAEVRFDFSSVQQAIPPAAAAAHVMTLELALHMDSVYFSDDSRWSTGFCYRPSGTPGKPLPETPPCVFPAPSAQN